MALASTTVSSAVSATDNTIVVASATSMAAGRVLIINQEFMRVTNAYVSGTTVPVLRGIDGTVTGAHKVNTPVTHGLASDFALPTAGNEGATTYPTVRATVVTSYSATGTMVLPLAGSDLRVILNGTSVITLTVPVPTKDMDGTMLTILGNGAAAHVVTFTGGVGAAGSSYDAFTVNATAPIALVVFAANGTWQMVAAPGITGTVTNITAGVA